MIGEFAYEEIIEPVPVPHAAPAPDAAPAPGPDPSSGTSGSTGEARRYTLPIDATGVLTFRARRGAYGSWGVDPGSVECGGRPFTGPPPFLPP